MDSLYCVRVVMRECFPLRPPGVILSIVEREEPTMEASKEEMRGVVRFLSAEGVAPVQIHRRMVAVYGENSLSYSRVKVWAGRFRAGRESLSDDPRPGQSHRKIHEDSIRRVNDAVQSNRRITEDEIAAKVDVSHGSVHTILHKHLQYRKICAQWVPKQLSEQQKHERVEAAEAHLARHSAEGDTFLHRIVTGDESWCLHFDPEGRRASMEWKHSSSPPAKKVKAAICGGRKVMLTFFFDYRGPLLVEFLGQGMTINAARYCSTLDALKAKIKSKRPGLLTQGVILLHDNARPHLARTTVATMAKFRWEILKHPPYSPDMSPCDFHVFGPLKKHLKGRRFASDEEVQEEVADWIASRPREFWEQGISSLVKQWSSCSSNGGAY